MSRFVYNDLERPKRVAKKLLPLLSQYITGLTLARSREIVADMLGFENWHQLETVSRSEPASAYDHSCAEDIVRSRSARQASALQRAGLPPNAAAEIAVAVHVSNVHQKRALDMTTPWWTATSCTDMPAGMMRVEAAFSSGIAVPKALVAEMPPLLRSKADHNGYAWYETGLEDCLVPLALPHLFTPTEVERARQQATDRYPELMQALEAGKRISSYDLRPIRPHRIEGRGKPRAGEFFSLHIKGLTFVGEIHGNEPLIIAYSAGYPVSVGGGYLGAVALKYILQTPRNRSAPRSIAWGVHKYGHDYECNILLEGFDHADADRLSKAFGIDYMRENRTSFLISEAWAALQEWAKAHPRRLRNASDGTHIAWVRLSKTPPDADWLSEISKRCADRNPHARDYMILEMAEEQEVPSRSM